MSPRQQIDDCRCTRAMLYRQDGARVAGLTDNQRLRGSAARLDVLIEAEDVLGIVGVFQLHESVVGGAVGRLHRIGTRVRSEVIHIGGLRPRLDRKSTRLNSSHITISYAVFCLKKKNRN